MRLKDRRVVLTGASGGLGKALAGELRRAGAKVITAGRSEGCDIVADLSVDAGIGAAAKLIAAAEPDVLINNAGISYFGHTHQQDHLSSSALIRVNLEVPVILSQAVLPGMLKRGGGQIVNIGSVFGAIPFPCFSVYSATKGGLKAFSQSLRREYAQRGIEVTYIAPRAIRTPMSGGAVEKLMAEIKSPMDDPAIVAGRIVAAVEAGRSELTLGFFEGIFSKVNGLCPSIVDRAMIKTKKAACNVLDNVKRK